MAGPDVAMLRSKYTGPHELVNASDGSTIFVRLWDGDADSSVSVLVMHGITAYSGPYGPMIAEDLASAGFKVFGMDLRGHGLSDGSRGDYPSKERLVKDLTETVSFVRSKSRRLIVLGHSLGVLSAVVAANNSPGDVDGLVLLSAAKRVKTGIYARPKLTAAAKTFLGVALLHGTPLIDYRREGMLGLDDPLFVFKYSARFYSVMYGTSALSVARMFRSGLLDSPNLAFKHRLEVPLLVGVGDRDELFAVDAVREFYDGLDCGDKEFFVAPGARHAVWPRGAWGPLKSWLEAKFRGT